jgi:hypothetical protein
MKTENKCPCGVELYEDVQVCPTCADRLQLEMYEDQLDWEEREAETLIAMMKEDGFNYLYDGPF